MAKIQLATTINNPSLGIATTVNNPTIKPNTQPLPRPQIKPATQLPPKPSVSIQQPTQPSLKLDFSSNFARLGERVKQVYPGIYDDIPDGQLGQIVDQKFPGVYSEFLDIPTQSEDAKPEGQKGVGGFLAGQVKGVGHTLNTISGFGQKALQKLTGLEQPVAQVNPELLAPHGFAEKFGFGTEQVAEFFLPETAISKGTKAIEGAEIISKLPKVIQGGVKLAGRAALEGAGAAAVTAAQGGGKKDVELAGGLGAGLTVVGKVIDKFIQKVPDTAWSSILKRTPTDAAKNPNLTRQAAETGLTGISRKSIATKAGQAIQNIEVTLDDLLSKSKGTVNTAKVAGYLNDLRSSYAAIPGEQASVKAIDDIAGQLYETFKQGKPMTVLGANQLKRDIYSVISKSYGKGMFEIAAKTEAQKAVAAGLKREIEKVIPEVKSLNEKQAVYIQIKKALDKTIARTEGKGIAGTGVGLYDLLSGGIGTTAGIAIGHPLLGVGTVALKKTSESPAVLSATAKLLNYFNQLSPTKRLLFYRAMQGLTVKSGVGIRRAVSQPE
jgi:hypothetical protein